MLLNTFDASYIKDIEFPDFWKQAWKEHFLSQLLLVEMRNNKINVLYDGGGWRNRHKTIQQSLSLASELCNSSSNKRFFVFTGDDYPIGVKTPWKLLSITGRREDKEIVIPDPHSFAWVDIGIDDFESYRKEMIKFSNECIENKSVIKKAFWRGSVDQHVARRNFCELVKDHPCFDVENVNNASQFREMKFAGEYAVLLDFPGQGHSGRLKHLLFSGRPVVVYPRLSWDWVTLNLEPNIHFCLSNITYTDTANSCINLINNEEYGNFLVKKCFEKSYLIERKTLITETSKIIEKSD